MLDRGAVATAEDVGADDKKFISVNRLTGADMVIPPAGAAGFWMKTGEMGVTGERVANENRVVARRREFAECLVGDIDMSEFVTGLGANAWQADDLCLRHAERRLVAGHFLIL